MYKSKYIHGGLYLSRSEKKAAFSSYSSPALYNGWVTQTKHSCMSTPWSWSGGGRRQVDKVGWGWKVMEMGWGTDKDEKGKKGGRTMTPTVCHCCSLLAFWYSAV